MRYVQILKEDEEYKGQNDFISKMRDNPRFVARIKKAILQWKNDIRSAYENGKDNEALRVYLDDKIIGLYPHNDSSFERINARLGTVNWDDIEDNVHDAYMWAMKILNDALEHPIDWDCISGAAMRHVIEKSAIPS